MTAYYNEINPDAAAHLRSLIAAGQIAPGIVDERSIEDVRPDELAGYAQCHFFAGIGIWSFALRQAGIPDDYPVWSMSCPCQPFSAAGKGEGFADERHLWPAAFHLISQCRPERIVGEQVDAAIRSGWWDLVADDLEALGYATAAAVIPSSAVGAPHMRHRLFFTANFEGNSVYENLLKVSDLQTTRSICSQQTFGRQVEVRLQSVPESLESSIFETTEPAGGDTAQGAEKKISISGEGLFALEKDYVPGKSAGLPSQDQSRQEGSAIRLGSARESIAEPDRCGVLRTDGNTVSPGFVQELRQPITGQDSAGTWVHVCQREGCLLCDELRAGNMGRSAFALDAGILEEEKGSLKNDALDVIQAHSKNDNDAGGQTDIRNQGIGAPHIRDRAYWCAGVTLGDTSSTGLERFSIGHSAARGWQGAIRPVAEAGESGWMADTEKLRREGEHLRAGQRLPSLGAAHHNSAIRLGNTSSDGRDGVQVIRSDGGASTERQADGQNIPGQSEGAGVAVDANCISGCNGAGAWRLDGEPPTQTRSGPANGYWADVDWLWCRDGRWRPVEPGTFPLAHGMPRSMGAMPPELRGLAELAGLSGDSLKRAKNYRTSSLKGYGNAINAEAAKAFIECLFYPSNQPLDQWICVRAAINNVAGEV